MKHIITNWTYYANTALLIRKVFKVLMKKVWKELIGGYLQAYFLIMLHLIFNCIRMIFS